ncbi:MAG: polyphosphate kinase 1 [Fimbriimonadaceae bacterium]|nr:polyphosphate kinase 1 [Fimbriimonadaceae bacterium]
MSRLKKPDPSRWQRSDRYVNREYSWLQFNKRVLEEAANQRNPLLERLKFLAIFESNLDEFFMVRVSGLFEQVESGIIDITPDGLTPKEQIQLINETALPLRRQAATIWLKEILPELAQNAIHIRAYADLTPAQKESMEEFFQREVFPVCTPLILHPAPSVPFISNRSLNLAVELADPVAGPKLARVKVPNVIPRLVRLHRRRHDYVLLEDVIQHNLQSLFPGVEIVGSHRFRVLRDADIEIRELEAADLVSTVEETIRMRRFGAPVLLETNTLMPRTARDMLMKCLDLEPDDVYDVDGLLGLEALWELTRIDKPALRYPPYHPYFVESLNKPAGLFKAISERDLLLHHPFDAFQPVQAFVESAQTDPSVIGIKQTLYRVGSESPVVEALLDAAEAGKQVAVMVELKARFDESNNLVWARALERAGAHVTYGFREMKTHCKLCLVVRRESGGIRTYAHIGTGNYNPATARLYTDLGLFTADPEICQDISELFNFLTGFSKQVQYRKLLVAPMNLREGIIDRIQREVVAKTKTGKGHIIFKLNSLVDPEVIDELYDAAEAGVEIDLIVRGICCLRPGEKAPRKKIRVRSIVGRFLEHSRVYWFQNGGHPEAFIGSADLMRRNLDRRIEVLAPVQDATLVAHLRDVILQSYLDDNVQTWVERESGEYSRLEPGKARPFVAQNSLMGRSSLRSVFGS